MSVSEKRSVARGGLRLPTVSRPVTVKEQVYLALRERLTHGEPAANERHTTAMSATKEPRMRTIFAFTDSMERGLLPMLQSRSKFEPGDHPRSPQGYVAVTSRPHA